MIQYMQHCSKRRFLQNNVINIRQSGWCLGSRDGGNIKLNFCSVHPPDDVDNRQEDHRDRHHIQKFSGRNMILDHPEIDPEQLIGYTFVVERPSGNYRAEVVQQIEDNHDKFIVKVGDSGREKILHYNDLISEIEKAREQGDKEEKIWTFDTILDHYKEGDKHEVQVQWDDGDVT